MTLQRSRAIAWAVWLIASVFYAYQYILRVLPNIMMPEIMTKFDISSSLFGQFSGLYYIGYAGMHIPIGLMLDRFGPKYVMPFCILLAVAGLVPLVYSDMWLYPCIGRVFIGIGSSAAILGVFKIIRMTFPEKKFTRMLGFSVTIVLLGSIYGGYPVNYLLQTLGWEQVLNIMAGIGLCLAAAIYFLAPAYQADLDNKTSIWADLKDVFGNSKILHWSTDDIPKMES